MKMELNKKENKNKKKLKKERLAKRM